MYSSCDMLCEHPVQMQLNTSLVSLSYEVCICDMCSIVQLGQLDILLSNYCCQNCKNLGCHVRSVIAVITVLVHCVCGGRCVACGRSANVLLSA